MQNSDLFLTYLLNLLTYLLALIPLPVYNFVWFTSILFFYAFDYTGLGLVGFGLGLIIPGLGVDLGFTVLWSPCLLDSFLNPPLSWRRS